MPSSPSLTFQRLSRLRAPREVSASLALPLRPHEGPVEAPLRGVFPRGASWRHRCQGGGREAPLRGSFQGGALEVGSWRDEGRHVARPRTKFLGGSPTPSPARELGHSPRPVWRSPPPVSGTPPAHPSWAVLARRGTGFLAEMEAIKEQERDAKEGGAVLDFEAPLEVVLYPDPRLRLRNKRITDFKDPRLHAFAAEMLDAMYRTDGVGLSAPQVGVNVQLMVFNPKGERGQGTEYVLINPRITKSTKLTSVDNEGCLSFPKIYADVERPEGVKVEAQDIAGKRFSLNLKGWLARIFQHEFDHLLGKLYFERMSPEVLDSIRPQLLDLEAVYEQATSQPRPETVGKATTLKSDVLSAASSSSSS